MEQPPPLPNSLPPPPPPANNPLQFDKVEYADEPVSAATCVACSSPITDSYFEVNGKVVCPNCKEQLQGSLSSGSKAYRLTKAVAFGFVAALLSAFGYYFIAKVTNMELAIATIAMGWLIGKGVHRGGHGRGGWFYMIVAALLTYLAISASLLSLAVGGSGAGAFKELGSNITLLLTYLITIPVLAAISSPILFLIYGFGLWQAARMNLRPHIAVTGPYYTNRGSAASASTGGIPDNHVI